MDKYLLPLEEGKFYHIYNQGNNKENIFLTANNYEYFLRKFDLYLSDLVEVYAFCLMPNHFHFLIRVKEFDRMDTMSKHSISSKYGLSFENLFPINGIAYKKLMESENKIEVVVSELFRRLFLSYSKSINKQTGRTGSLFRKNFKRKEITDSKYLQQAVIYIHRNPLHHGFSVDFRDYPWSTYSKIVEDRITKLRKEEVLGWFDNKKNYLAVHQMDITDDIE